MIRSYIAIALRNLVRNKSFSLINILGLSVGLAASLLIALWVFDELSYDHFHANADNIYRVERHINWDGRVFDVPVTGGIYAEAMKRDIPEIVDFSRIYPIELNLWNHMNSSQEERVMFCDSGFFNVFSFPLLKGDPQTALKEPYSVVLTKSAALALFGKEYPIDETLEFEWDDGKKNLRVTGIMDDIPNESHFQFGIVASFETLEVMMPERFDDWVSNYLYTYVLLHPGSNLNDVNNKMRAMVEEYIAPAYMTFLGDDAKIENIHDIYQMRLRPISEIHLMAKLMWEIEPQGNIVTVYIFAIVSILILLMACFNFMNLSTALGSKRSREIGIRKTAGATREQLIAQLISESIAISLVSMLVALLAIEIILPGFNTFTGKSLSLYTFLDPVYFGILLAIVLGSGVLAGLYPAFYLSRFEPMVVLRKNVDSRGAAFSFRQVLVVFQFSISILLIIGTLTAYLQINYFYDKPLGYTIENLMVISTESNEIRNNFDSYKAGLKQFPEVVDVTFSGSIPASLNFSDNAFRTETIEDMISSINIGVSYDFFKTYGIEFIAGRPFLKEFGTDTANKYIVNQRLVDKIGIADAESAIGLHYGPFERDGSWVKGEIIGVVKDFHFKPMNQEIEPLTFQLEKRWLEYITVRYETEDEQGFITKLEAHFKKSFPNDQFNYFNLQERYQSLYIDESRLKNVLLAFTFLAVFVGCLGLFGLAAFIAQQKSKEIGIRKVHGAPVESIVFLLTKQFTYWVLLANIIAWPLAFYFLDNWLSTFYYRIDMPYWVFVVSGLIALVLAVVTVSYKAYKAAVSDPLDAIKYE